MRTESVRVYWTCVAEVTQSRPKHLKGYVARERLHERIYSRPISRRKENRTEENKAVFPRGRRTFKKTVLYASFTLRRCNPWVLMRFSVDRTRLIHVYISEWENVVSMQEFWPRARRQVGKNSGNFLVFPVSTI